MNGLVRFALRLGSVVGLLALGCGGASSPAAPAKSGEKGEEPTGEPADGGASLAHYREQFMAACGKNLADAPDYCECSWALFRKSFSESEMGSQNPDPHKMAKFQDEVGAACGDKLPEPVIFRQFIEGCNSKGKGLEPYCSCAWTELRKKLSVADFTLIETAESPRMEEARASMLRVCSPRLPERVPRDGFVRACVGDKPGAEAFCRCAWKQLRTTHSAAEIFAGGVDMSAAKPKIRNACAKLHPANNASGARP